MKLKEVLEKQPDDRLIYVGAASSFLAAGTKDDLPDELAKQDDRISKRIEAKRADALARYRIAQKSLGEEHDTVKLLHQEYIRIADPVPLMEREVLFTHERISEDALNIVVVGDETGTIWSVKTNTQVALNYNIEDLVGSIIREVLREYKRSLKSELKVFKELVKRLEEYRKNSEVLEAYFRSKDAKRFLTFDPEYIIKRALDGVAEELDEKSKEKP